MILMEPSDEVIKQIGDAFERDHWRYTFAGMAMQGTCSMPISSTYDVVAERCVQLADALLAELERGEQ